MVKDKTYFINNIPIPETRNDHYLFYLINGGVFEDLPQPHSKLEHYLYNLCLNKASNKTKYMKMILNSDSEGQNYASTIFDLGDDRVNSAKVKFRFSITNDGIDFPKSVRIRLFADNESDQNNIVASNRSYMYDSNTIEELSSERIYEIETEYPFSINGHKLSEFRYLKPYLMLNKENVGYGSTHSLKLYRVELIINDKIYDITTTAKDFSPLDNSSVRYIDEKHGEDGTVWIHGVSDPTIDTNGNEGDFYLNTASGKVFVRLGNGTWSDIGLTLKGTQGISGKDGKNGVDGKTWKPSVDELGNLTWLLNNEESAPKSVNIKGDKGDKGADGTSVKILGSYDTEEALKEAHPDNNTIGDGYIVEENLVIWDGTKWKNVGKIKGDKGNDGNKLWVISIVPIDTVGNDGDVSINKTKWDVYFKENGAWVLQGNIKGEQGLQGTNGKDGNTWHSGEVQPENTIGNDGDFYLDTLTFKVYKKENNDWVQKGIIKGNDGQRGLSGDSGTKWHIGDTAPSTNIGVEGDYYLSKDTWNIYIKSADGIWKDQGSIKGEQGEQGEAGVSGTNGEATVVKGEKGEDGKTWKPSVSDTGELSWVLDTNTTQAPATVNIKGKDGAKGIDGAKWFNGSGEPNGTNTANSKAGDYYLDVAKGDVYTKGSDEVWKVIGNIKGKDGVNGTGTNGTVWQDGQDGKDGSVWFNGIEDPTKTTIEGAKQGDYYLNNDNGNYYYYDGSNWTSKGVLKGEAGAKGQNGTRGSKWFSDASAPDSSSVTTDKALGDYYLDTMTGNYYEYDGAKWNKKGTLTGGTSGETATVVGQKGEKGEDGTKWHNGDGDPKALQIENVKNGDLFLDNQSGKYYEYDGQTWNEKGTLKGEQGEVGPKGDTGAIGPQGPKGADGTGVTILGSYDSEDALNQAQPTGKAGDSYLVQGNLYVWDGTKWKNVGTIQGPKGDRGLQGETGPQGPQGLKGETGSQGPIGQTGPKGADGVSIKSITQTTTSTADGGTNVITIATSDGKSATFSVKNGTKGEKGDTGLTGSQGERGLQGPKGDKGATWFTGNGLPSATIKGQGVIGDYYLNSVDGFVYRKDTNNDNGWVKTTVDLTGPVGATGPTGLEGKAGKNGNRWLNGSGTPTSTNPSGAITGDYFLQNSSGIYWQKQSDGEWKQLGVLKGATGETGAKGQDGATGPQGKAGVDGTRWLVGKGVPDGVNTEGSKVGDFYLDTDTSIIRRRDDSGWTELGKAYTHPETHPASMITETKNGTVQDFFDNGGSIGGPTTVSGSITASTGNIIATLGGIIASAGNITASKGNIVATTGEVRANSNIVSTKGNIQANTGNITASAGNIVATTGNIQATAGSLIGARLKGTTASGGENSIYLGEDERQGRISTGAGGVAIYVTPHTTDEGKNTGIHLMNNGDVVVYNAGAEKHRLGTNGTLTTSAGITANSGNIQAKSGNISASGNVSAGANLSVTGNATINGTTTSGKTIKATTGNIQAVAGQVLAQTGMTSTTGHITATAGKIVGGVGVTANTGNVVATKGNVQASVGSLVGNRLKGSSNADRINIGGGNCRIDTTSGVFRLFTSALGGTDSGFYYTKTGNPAGGFHIRWDSVDKHIFYANGNKTGGTMEIDGTVYGMSPTDSPQTLIEYVVYDEQVQGEKIIKLDSIYAKMISKYAVFSSNPDIKIIKKEANQFTVQGNGLADFVIKGQRKDGEEYYRIMGGLTHGVTEEQTN